MNDESTLDHFWFRPDGRPYGRDLSSRLGRFMTADPIAGSLADPQSLNRYSYVRNDPVNLIDPLGLRLCISFVRFTPVTRETVGGEGTSGIRNDALLVERVIYCPGLSREDIKALYQKVLEKLKERLKKAKEKVLDDVLPNIPIPCKVGAAQFGGLATPVLGLQRIQVAELRLFDLRREV